jgi:predicted ATPase
MLLVGQTMEIKLNQRADYTFKYNQKLGRHGWLRLNTTYYVKIYTKINSTTNYKDKQITNMKISTLSLKGFKTIKHLENLEFNENINLFIGANGSGKSNLISFFEMISYIMTESLQQYIADNGFANTLLYFGSKTTSQIEAIIKLTSETSENKYYFRLSHIVGDSLVFAKETINYQKNKEHQEINLSGNSKETELKNSQATIAKSLRKILNCIRIFHFHDTSKNSFIKQARILEDNTYLKSDGGNLASFLYRLKDEYPKHYNKIKLIIRQIAPFFDDFILIPNKDYILLKYKEIGSDIEFGAFRLSDGTLRFMALATLLIQPKETMPAIIIIDEPELGLHPVAIDKLASLLITASKYSQIFITTQSERLLNNFEAENIIVVSREKEIGNNRYYSDFRQLNKEELETWLAEYSLSQIWESNIIGGRP